MLHSKSYQHNKASQVSLRNFRTMTAKVKRSKNPGPLMSSSGGTPAALKRSLLKQPTSTGSLTKSDEDQLISNQSCAVSSTSCNDTKTKCVDLKLWNDESVALVAKWWNLNDSQVSKLWELRDRLEDVKHWKNQPNEVVRYLRDARFHVKHADAKFRRMVQWRVNNQVDDILTNYRPPHPLLFEYVPTTVLDGLDKEGDPIWIERVGAADSWGLFQRFGHEELIRYAVYIREVCIRGPWAEEYKRRAADAGGKPPMRATAIVDLAGMTWDHFRPSLLPLLKEGLSIVQEYYCGFGKKIIVIRVSKLFPIVWKVAQHFCNDNLRNMLVFATADNYLEVLQEYVDLDTLPPCLYEGGTGQGGVGMPSNLQGGKVPTMDELDRIWIERQQSTDTTSNPPGSIIISTSHGLAMCSSNLTDESSDSINLRSTSNEDPSSSSSFVTDNKNVLQPEEWSEENFQKAMKQFDGVTLEEQAKIRELGKRVSDVNHWKNKPNVLLYYLRDDKDKNMDRAEKRFRATIQWRIENGIDDMAATYRPPKLLLEYFSNTILRPDCCDLDGDPIYIERPGSTDSWSLYQRFGTNAMCDYLIWIREEAARGKFRRDYESLHEHPPYRITVIVDLQGLSARHMKPGLMPLFKQVMQIVQNHYCGMAKRIFVIRAPRIFKLIWAICQHFLTERVKNLIVFASDADYLEVLSDFIDLEVLPPCIYKGGRGTGAIGLPKRLDGGMVPPPTDHDSELASPEDIDPPDTDCHRREGGVVSAKVAWLGGGCFAFTNDDGDANTVLTVSSS